MVEMRRKNKTVPVQIKPPENPEEWIERANADGEAPAATNQTAISPKGPKAKAGDQQQQNQEIPRKVSRSIPDKAAAGSAPSRYISFAIDHLTLGLFRELCFTLDRGNADTLVYIIKKCAAMDDEGFLKFSENKLVFGSTKRTMSFLIPQESIDTVDTLSKRLRIRNKSFLYRYLIQILANSLGIVPKG